MPLILTLDTKDRTDKTVNIYDRDSRKLVLKMTILKATADLLQTPDGGRIQLAFDGDAIVLRESICDDTELPVDFPLFGSNKPD